MKTKIKVTHEYEIEYLDQESFLDAVKRLKSEPMHGLLCSGKHNFRIAIIEGSGMVGDD